MNLIRKSCERIATGSVNDTVRLILRPDEITDTQLEGMDFFSMSEIKRHKDGAIEVKFHDRIEALRLLYQIEVSKPKDAKLAGLISALQNSALTSPVSDNEGGAELP